nr:polymer-forming cytoskeletal protein [uncultured Dyadobacter sp.]
MIALLHVERKFKANVLLLVVVLAMICGILSSAIVMIGYYHRSVISQTLLQKRLELNAQSGVQWLLASPDSIARFERTWDLFGDGTDSVTVTRQPWGMYEVGTVVAYAGRASRNKAFLMGWGNTASQAIYLADNGIALSVSGETSILGPCKLPEVGVKSVQVEGFQYPGTDPVQGKIGRSSFDLPPVNKALVSYLGKLIDTGPEHDGWHTEMDGPTEPDTLRRSFTETPALLYHHGVLDLRNVYEGQLVIVSDSLIRIAPRAQLHDVIVIAPVIVVQDGFQGNAQLLATDSVRIGKGCSLLYPSAIGLLKRDFHTTQPSITIGENSLIEGVLMAFQEVQDLQQTIIKIADHVLVTGQVYADGFLELHGRVHGEVICRKFVLQTPSSVYENYLVNAVIDAGELPVQYVGSALFSSSSSSRKIVKWY